MLVFNPMTAFIAKISKAGIQKGSIVTVVESGDWETHCTVKDRHGNESEYLSTELKSFGILEKSGSVFEIEVDGLRKEIEGVKDMMKGRIQLTKNVRSGMNRFIFCQDCRYLPYIDDSVLEYIPRELTNEEVCDIILEEVIYGINPNLQSTSLVGTSLKGLDKDPNYHDGHYFLPNEKDYTVTWCRGKIIIREGVDGGWYPGGKTGKVILETEMDWERHKQAVIKSDIRRQFGSGKDLINKYPSLEEIVYQEIKDEDRFKLSHEF